VIDVSSLIAKTEFMKIASDLRPVHPGPPWSARLCCRLYDTHTERPVHEDVAGRLFECNIGRDKVLLINVQLQDESISHTK
jgi:hypothetical protein